jgi:iron-sulfur cluster insertion protein
MNITITEKAISEIKRVIQEEKYEQDKVALRVRVVGGGCSGFQTKLDLDEKFDEKTDNLTDIDGIKIAVDKRSALYLEGASIDYHEDLNKRGFIVNNPGARSTCGCGSSFSM